MRYAVGCDHAGFALKNSLIDALRDRGIDVTDVGTDGTDSVDYPEFASKVAEAMVSGRADMGLLLCGSGLGMALTANRFPGIRAVPVTSTYLAEMARRHNDANVLCMGARVLDEEAALEVLGAWLDTPFAGGRHQRRVDMMMNAGPRKGHIT